MKIELEHPYSQDWKYGYIVVNPDNRRTLVLYNSHTDRSSTQYARYLLAVKLGRYLTADETVDHDDEDKTNDSITNLNLMSLADNVSKSCKLPNVVMNCPYCACVFERTRSDLRGRLDKAMKNEIYCSRRCAVAAQFGK